MFVFKGFATNTLFIDNSEAALSPVGEISQQALTYALDVSKYSDPTIPEIDLYEFTSKVGTVNTVVPTDLITSFVDIVKAVYDAAVVNTNPIYADELLASLIPTFQTQATKFELGNFVPTGVGSQTCPEYISFETKLGPNAADSFVKIWLSDASFKQQYDEFVIKVIPPVVDITYFYRPAPQVGTLIEGTPVATLVNRVQDVKEGHPETLLRAETYNYIDPLNNTNRIATTWMLLIYGAAGNNIDAINDALVDYILTNSDRDRNYWKNIFPDIFKRTEFVIAPLWNQYSIPNRETEVGIYSPIVNPNTAAAIVAKALPTYLPTHIDENMEIFHYPFRSIGLAVVGSIDNVDRKFKLSEVFPDYIAVSSLSPDFNRMSQTTQAFSYNLGQLLFEAEKATNFSAIPNNLSRTSRDGVLYLVTRVDNVNYLVATKNTLPRI